MEGRIAQRKPDLVRMLGHDLLDDRIEGAAGLAGGIEELDDGDRRVLRPDDRGMHPHEAASFHSDARVLFGLCAVAIGIHAEVKGQAEDQQHGECQEFSCVHLRVLIR